MVRLQKQWVFIDRAGAAPGRDFCNYCLVRSLAPLVSGAAPRRGSRCPAARDLALKARWQDALAALRFSAARRARAAPATAEARDGAAVVVEDGARTMAAAPRTSKAVARGDAHQTRDHSRRRAAPS